MSLALTGSSWVLQDDQGAAEVVFDIDFRQLTNQTLNAGVNTLSDGTACWVELVDSPLQHQIVNGEGLTVRCEGASDTVRVYFNVTGAVNAGKPAGSPGLYNARDRLRVIAEVSGSGFVGAASNGPGMFMGLYNGFEVGVGSGVFAGTPIKTSYNVCAIHVDSDNSNKLTPRIWYDSATAAAANADYTPGTRAVTADHTFIVLETDNFEGSGWTRYKTGSAPLAPYSTGLPTPDDLTTFGRARLEAAVAVAIGSDDSPFTGSVLANVSFWSGYSGGQVTGSLTRLAVLRYGNVK
tara:strand:- start:956 stop:1837 length:882 start_codon:yes stop_codon:yes gene_type:complete